MSGQGGFNAKQLKLLGVGWPPYKGWQEAIIGSEISEAEAELFIRLKGVTRKRNAESCRRLFEQPDEPKNKPSQDQGVPWE